MSAQPHERPPLDDTGLRPEGTDGGCVLGTAHRYGLRIVGTGDNARLVRVCATCGHHLTRET